MKKPISQIAFDTLTSEDDGRVCKDIPESACNDQPQNFTTHILSLSLTKVADGFIDPKLILSWLLSTLGAPIYFIGLLVPIREAGALLPQLFTAVFIRSLPLRKYAWAFGSFTQGFCAVAMGFAMLQQKGFALGLTVTILLAVLALARSICSVSYKDVLGKTVSKSKRGTATGAASSIAAGLVIIYALIISSEIFNKLTLATIGLFLAGGFWITASVLFLTLTEKEGATEGGGSAYKVAKENFQYLAKDREFILFITTRALLIATALAPPFMVALVAKDFKADFAGLGWLVLASALAGFSSSYIWGRQADRSSRKVLIRSGLFSGVTLAATVICAHLDLLQIPWLLPFLLSALMIAYQGVRIGRSTHLVDIAKQDTRSIYTALSNTIIGLLLMVGGVFSIIATQYGEVLVLAIFSLMCFTSVLSAYKMNEAQ